MTTQFQVNGVANANVDNSEESLIATLELALVKDLNGDNRGLFDVTRQLKKMRQSHKGTSKPGQ